MVAISKTHATVFSDDAVTTEGNTYYERKAEGRCTYAGCPHDASDESVLCPEHLEGQRERTRRSQNAKRSERRSRGECPRCGKDAQGDYMCQFCRVRYGRTKTARRAGDDNGEHNDKAARIAARLIAWENSPTNEGRLRLRGGKRGRPSAEVLDSGDLTDAKKALDIGVAGMEHATRLDKADPSVRIPKIQRDDVRSQALAKLVEAGRWIAEVVKRHGYEVPVAIVEDEDDEP